MYPEMKDFDHQNKALPEGIYTSLPLSLPNRDYSRISLSLPNATTVEI